VQTQPDADDSLQRAINEEIALIAYDARWPGLFTAERDRLLQLFPAQLLAIEHIGSTAVPGMPAKPVIDLLAGVESMRVADEVFEPLLQNGYTTSRAFNDMLPARRWFMRASEGRRTHHLHVVVMGSREWVDRVRFRDVMRSRTDLACAYADLKHQLAAKHRSDREAYTDAKSEFIERVLAIQA
jgi:GrpB-like predicted nucleotidyltransferase (UPF0157 family)